MFAYGRRMCTSDENVQPLSTAATTPDTGLGEIPQLPGGSSNFPPIPAEEDADGPAPVGKYEAMPIVGLGGSAGGIQALRDFFQVMPADSGLVFVVVLHLSPEHVSTLPELLQRATAMPVVQAADGVKVEANHVYVIPPGTELKSTDGHLRLTPLQPELGKRLTIDVFFRTLADTHGPQAVAVVLSGANGDGASGLKRIKESGGLTIVQSPDEAEHETMPRAAIATGLVDWVLPVREIPGRVLEYVRRAPRIVLPPVDGPQPAQPPKSNQDESEAALHAVFALLRTRTGRDFSYYKRATILRRVARRMQVNGAESMPDYLTFLRAHPGETGALLQDLLISVTNFFRDPEAFAALEARIPEMFFGKGPQDTVRAWCAACATGEEAYSLAMLLTEHASKLASPPLVQVFATDLDEEIIQKARNGMYAEAIATDVSQERLARFFIKEHDGFRVRRELREVVLFAVHDVLKDAPFSRLDLVTCRNLLIYLNREAQQEVLAIFHFALQPEGKLFLGSSESVDEESNLFTPLDKAHRLYLHQPVAGSTLVGHHSLTRMLRASGRVAERQAASPAEPAGTIPPPADRQPEEIRAGERHAPWGELHQRVMEQLGPASMIVDQRHHIVHLSQAADRYLQFGVGELSKSVTRAVHPMLRLLLRATLSRAAQSSQPEEALDVPVELDGRRQAVDIRVSPTNGIIPDCFLIVFEPRPASPQVEGGTPTPEAERVTRQLEQEVDGLKSHLREVEEQHDAVTEEHKAGNEELQAMNEELRSSSEELETSRAELQSINEELTTVNGELKGKVEELGHANSDLANLMDATAIATVFLDRELRITRFTPTATGIFNLIDTDIGRPIAQLRHLLDYPTLEQDAARVLKQLAPIEREVTQPGNGHLLVRLLPYRTLADRIAGVVVACVDITASKRAEEARAFLAAIVESSEDSIVSVDFQQTITSWNASAERLYGYPAAEVLGKPLTLLTLPEDLTATLRRAEQIKHSQTVEIFDTKRVHKDGHEIWLSIVLSPVKDAEGQVIGMSTLARDVTAHRRAEAALRDSQARYERIAANVPGMVYQFVLRADKSFEFPFVSDGCREIFGLEPEQIQANAQLIRNMVHPEDRQEFAQSIKESAASLQPWTWQGRIVRADSGKTHFLQAASRPERQANGDIVWDGVFMDVTERQQVAEHRRAKEEAERTNKAKSVFLSRMSHELRTPLNAILGFGQILELSARGPDDALALSHILKGGRHLLSLVDEILDLSRAESGELHLSFGIVDADELAHDCVALVTRLAETHGISCRFQASRQGISVWADQQRLRQVLLNLLSNAIKYNRPGGDVVLSIERTPAERVRLKVSDTGPGISPEALARLFVPFERLNQEYGEVEGTGLGLVISRQIAEAMGGTLDVESKVGEGSTFWVEVPLAKSNASPPDSAVAGKSSTSQPRTPQNATLLYIEDNASNLQVVQMLLGRSRPHWRFLSARDGKEGLALAQREVPDLILLDLQLPGLPGDEVLTGLRHDARTRRIPVIVLSADATIHSRDHLLASGADDYLSKPFQLDRMLDLLDHTLLRYATAREAKK